MPASWIYFIIEGLKALELSSVKIKYNVEINKLMEVFEE